METKITCPLGSECEKAVDGHLEVCAWYVTVAGKHPQSNEQIDEKKCAIAWMPILQIEVAGTNRGQTSALESFRNETVKGQNEMNQILVEASNKRLSHDS